MGRVHYDGLAAEYDAFMDAHSGYYRACAEALARLLGRGDGPCLDLGCGGGHFIDVTKALGWRVVGIDLSADQLSRARVRHPDTTFVECDAADTPFDDHAFDAAYSTFTHTDVDDFAGLVAEARRVLQPGGRFVYVGNHPCFVGATQEHVENGPPILHPGYRASGRRDAADAPGATPAGWRVRLGSFVHVPLGPLLTAFAGLTLADAEELDDGYDYPKTVALCWRKPSWRKP